MTSTLDGLLGALAAIPALPGAKCRGRPHLFDEPPAGEPAEITAARQAQALGLCARCPALTRCGDWLDTLRPSQRPPGVIAGRIVTPRKPRTKTPLAKGKTA